MKIIISGEYFDVLQDVIDYNKKYYDSYDEFEIGDLTVETSDNLDMVMLKEIENTYLISNLNPAEIEIHNCHIPKLKYFISIYISDSEVTPERRRIAETLLNYINDGGINENV